MDEEESSTSTSTPSFRYQWDVFLSFRGEGTRDNFTDRLYNELMRNGVRTFRDNEGLGRGEEISPSLLIAIEDSAASIAVISENYASSWWCLEELAKILECKRFILPVFYKVDPSNVRRQKGRFEAAFRDLEQRHGQKKVLRWREAMNKAGGVAGWDSRNWEESELIKSLVNVILIKLSNTPMGVAKHPVGINSRVEELMQKLDVKANGVRVVGFHGMGGIGKTTLAKAVYNRLVGQFKHRTFISNIRETSRQHAGLTSLQNMVIRDLFPDKASSPINDVTRGIKMIKQKIHDVKILVVLDDVDDKSQLNALAGSRDWFYEGSRIIITTRDDGCLQDFFIDEMYEVKELSSPESLQLFSYHAFGREKPPELFMDLSKQVASLTGRLPLALEVFGAFLFDKRRIKEWKDELKKLERIRPGNIQEVLKISFDGLDEEEKCIFLDIACFFVGMNMTRESAVDIIKGCGFSAEIAITVLTRKSLIKIIDENILWMHDQLRDMGRQIVQQESIMDPGMRSRLWDQDEILDVLKGEKGTRNVQGIIMDLGEKNYMRGNFEKISGRGAEKENQMKLCTEPFEKMVNLRLLQVNHMYLDGKFNLLPAELRWLRWKGCPLEALPSDMCLVKLSVLDLSESKIKQLWDRRRVGYKAAEKLTVMNLLGCYNLTASPDFSEHIQLEKLILERCKGLIKVHKSIGDLQSLVLLNLKDCSNLTDFPDNVSGLRNLEILVLSGCSKLKHLPMDWTSLKSSLRELLVDGTAVLEIPDSVTRLRKLERLSLNGCASLKLLPISIGKLGSLRQLSLNDTAVEELPNSIGSLTNLETLSLMRCRSINVIPDSIGNLKALIELFLNGTSIRELPDSIGTLCHLKNLSVGSCLSLRKVPNSVGGLASLVELQLDKTSLAELPDQIGALEMLEKLDLRNCELLRSLPDSIGKLSNLTTLILNDTGITELPESIGQLEKLSMLRLNKCRQLSKLPESIGKMKCLIHLYMEETGVEELPEEFGMLSSLMVLKMAKHKATNVGRHTELTALNSQKKRKLSVLPTSFSSLSLLEELDARYCRISGRIPDDFEKLSSLETLQLGYNSFCSLPSSLRGLSVLKKLSLPNCAELESLPPLPSSLIEVDVTDCVALESISDLSNLSSLEELRLTNCSKVKDIPGLECLISLKRLYMSGCNACFSVMKGRLAKVALKNFRNLSVPGSEIPSWLAEEELNFSWRKNHKIKGVVICVVVSLDQQMKDDFRDKLPAIVDILAKIVRREKPIFTTALYLLGVPKSHENQVYMCRYPDFHPLVSLLEDGDRIQVTMRDPPCFNGLKLKNYGIQLVFEDDDDIEDDDESLDETQQSVSGKLSKFFSSLEGVDNRSSSCSTEVERKTQQKEGRENSIQAWKFFLLGGVVLVALLVHFLPKK